jgi:hypothetical protein
MTPIINTHDVVGLRTQKMEEQIRQVPVLLLHYAVHSHIPFRQVQQRVRSVGIHSSGRVSFFVYSVQAPGVVQGLHQFIITRYTSSVNKTL